MNDVAVIGAGAWGTALAITAARAGSRVTLWARDPASAIALAASRQNPRLPGLTLPGEIVVTSDMPSAAITLLAVPLQHLRRVMRPAQPGDIVVVCCKGVESGTLKLPLEIVSELWPDTRRAVLTGPNFAHEVASGLPAAAVVAADDPALRQTIVAALATPEFRLYGNEDPTGAQVGGAAKNVIAIAAGAAIGAGLGENARAALVTRGLAELTRMAESLGGKAATISGLSGLGDLLLTCTGTSSRNFRVGVALGRGESLDTILGRANPVAEGVATAPALVARAAKNGVSLPICAAVAGLVTGRLSLAESIDSLMARKLRDE